MAQKTKLNLQTEIMADNAKRNDIIDKLMKLRKKANRRRNEVNQRRASHGN